MFHVSLRGQVVEQLRELERSWRSLVEHDCGSETSHDEALALRAFVLYELAVADDSVAFHAGDFFGKLSPEFEAPALGKVHGLQYLVFLFGGLPLELNQLLDELGDMLNLRVGRQDLTEELNLSGGDVLRHVLVLHELQFHFYQEIASQSLLIVEDGKPSRLEV